MSPTACPANSTSTVGATDVRDCKCAVGFFAEFGVDGEGAETLACVPCPAGTFNPADSVETTNAEQCVACPANTYFDGTGAASGGECVPCPVHTSAPAGSGEATACLCAWYSDIQVQAGGNGLTFTTGEPGGTRGALMKKPRT